MNLLDLAPELVLACVDALDDFADIRSLLRVGNRHLHALLTSSIAVRYRAYLDHAKLQENSHVLSTTLLADRLDAAKGTMTRWMSFNPISRHTITVDFASSGIYDLCGDYYFLGDAPQADTGISNSLRFIATSDPDAEWQVIDVGKPIIDFGLAIEEHDLIAVVTCATPENTSERTLDVQLLCFSTAAPHPQAAKSELHLQTNKVTGMRPSISLEVVGRTLAVSVIYWAEESRDNDILYFFDWRTGNQIMPQMYASDGGFTFVTPELLLIPNGHEPALDLICIPPADTKTTELLPIHTLRLPELQFPCQIFALQCRGDPNPRTSSFPYTTSGPGSRARPAARFLPNPTQSILYFAFSTGSPLSDVTHEHVFVIPRAAFAASVLPLLSALDPGVGADISWLDWGRYHARFLDATSMSRHYITTTVGTRLVAIAPDARVKAAPIRLLYFNENVVEAHKHVLDMPGGMTEMPTATLTVVPPDDLSAPPHFSSLESFTEAVASLVPYVEIESKEKFSFDAVIVNNENIIGVNFDGNNVSSLEVLYFG
ncbi:hypothetical protein MKEN_00313500 [Mycena kentingensis (nom. inval.)]|nr:hypothetical protein MKEN_00313500 [Mycena kentingensis (nom. inval.)]